MKRKRIQYNELSEEIYNPKYWTKPRLIITGIILIIIGFLVNFSLEEKLNKLLLATLSSNEACPILFEKVELSYFPPKVFIKKPVILGSCFGQMNNKLPLNNFSISLATPSFYPPGIKLHVNLSQGKTRLNIYPTISIFSQFIDIEDSKIDTEIFQAFTSDNKSPIAGMLSIEGFFKFSSGVVEDGQIKIKSNDFHIPAQNISGFEMSLINLNHLLMTAHFANKTTMKIDQIDIGKPGMPIELKLKGSLEVNPSSFISSELQLGGNLLLSNYILTNFSFIKLFLPESNTSGNYQMNIRGPLGNLGRPQFR